MFRLTFILLLLGNTCVAQTSFRDSIESKVLKEKRYYRVYLPHGFEKSHNLRTIYVFDSQAKAVFNQVNSMLTFVKGRNENFVVIGVESHYDEELKQSRNKDFFPPPNEEITRAKRGWQTGGADNFMRFLEMELFPKVEKQYNLKSDRVGIGWSNGGTFLVYTLMENPDLFQYYITISPNLYYDNRQLVDRLSEWNALNLNNPKFFYLSFSNENTKTDKKWKGWQEATGDALNILRGNRFQDKICLYMDDFSREENHGTVYPRSVLSSLKKLYEFINF